MKNVPLGKLLVIIVVFFILGVASFFLFFHKNNKPSIANEFVIVPTGYSKQTPSVDTSSWKTFTDKLLTFSIKYPSSVTIDSKETVEGRLDVFIFKEDQTKELPGKVTMLYIANTFKNGSDGFTAFRNGDCKKPCTISYKTTSWVNINNVYGIENPKPRDVANYYLTDKDHKGLVINAYIGGYTNTKDKETKQKMDTFGQMIKTIQFQRSGGHGH